MLDKIQDELKKINWTHALVFTCLGASAYYLYQNYMVKETEPVVKNRQRV